MIFFNLKHPQEISGFAQTVWQGLGKDQGLFFPETIPTYNDINTLLSLSFAERSVKLLSAFTRPDLAPSLLKQCVEQAFNFPVHVKSVTRQTHCLELFHGPTLAFKDFGARFMAQCLGVFSSQDTDKRKVTILTATSGDTGAAVAHAFHNLPDINVVILYPKNKITPLQEKLFTTLNGNIYTFAVEGTFDDCQKLVKQAFDDKTLKTDLGLTSANSINVSRLLAQVCYYFEGIAQLSEAQEKNIVISVPCGNFGNLTAGLIAAAMGLPVKRFIAATNSNDTIPRYLSTQKWLPESTLETLSSAMDVSQPNNWPRIEQLQAVKTTLPPLSALAVSEEETIESLRTLFRQNYLSEPHTAVAYHALKSKLKEGETGLFLGTAHPAKFQQSIEHIMGQTITLPEALANCINKPSHSRTLKADTKALLKELTTLT